MAGKKENYRKSGAARQRKEDRKIDAFERQLAYDKLSDDAKLHQIENRRGESAKERDKIIARLSR